MATKKKVIQGGVDVQKSDGTSALVVSETNGAVTLGPSTFTGTHILNGRTRVRSGSASLANGGTTVLTNGALPAVHFLRIDASGNLRVAQILTTAGAQTSAVMVAACGVGTLAVATTLNNPNTVNVCSSTTTVYTIQNNTGVAIAVYWSSFEIE